MSVTKWHGSPLNLAPSTPLQQVPLSAFIKPQMVFFSWICKHASSQSKHHSVLAHATAHALLSVCMHGCVFVSKCTQDWAGYSWCVLCAVLLKEMIPQHNAAHAIRARPQQTIGWVTTEGWWLRAASQPTTYHVMESLPLDSLVFKDRAPSWLRW